ncbi:MAG: hypothetical protein ACM3SW_18915, partial [Actinomycetota bacterium]
MRFFIASLTLVGIFLVGTLTVCAQATKPVAEQHAAPDIAGDWQGTLNAGVAQLHVVLHISKGDNGGYKATMDSVDQGANGIPINSISVKDSQLSFASDAVHGTYEGKINADASLIEGTWSQGMPMPLSFRRAVKSSDIDGAWLGTLQAGASKLRVLF